MKTLLLIIMLAIESCRPSHRSPSYVRDNGYPCCGGENDGTRFRIYERKGRSYCYFSRSLTRYEEQAMISELTLISDRVSYSDNSKCIIIKLKNHDEHWKLVGYMYYRLCIHMSKQV